jgi:hypothetical protein
MGYDKEVVDQALTPAYRERIFRSLGFQFNRSQSGRNGWTNRVLGPSELGEGKTPNFSVDLNSGAVKDHGSSGYSGDLYGAVQNVLGCSFPEALSWIADEVGISASSPSSREKTRAPTDEKSTTEASQGSKAAASLEDVQEWHDVLMGDTDQAQAARSYLLKKRGLHEEVVRSAKLGLMRNTKFVNGLEVEWWIVIPVPSREMRDADGDPEIVALKKFAFDPATEDWKRDKSDRKIPRNDGRTALYDVIADPETGNSFDGPVLICEGEIDALCAFTHQFNAVTGTGGAGTFKNEWAEYLAELRPAKEGGVVICFDGDDTGRKQAPKAAKKLAASGIDVRIASLPDGQDVNDVLLDGGREALSALIETAAPFDAPPQVDVEDTRSEPATEALPGKDGDGFPLSEVPRIPESVLPNLPPILKSTVGMFPRTYQRDVYLTSALACISACLPNLAGSYGEIPSQLHPNLYLAIVAGAAGGKSTMRFGQNLTAKINKHIQVRSEQERQTWREEKQLDGGLGMIPDRPEPPQQSLYLPANTSAASFLEGLKERRERALVVESEIDTLTNALGQEWGKFDDTLRKAYHHEPASYRRKSEGQIMLEKPRISLVLTGTPFQFETLMGSTENGLYSRFALYYFEAPQSWESQRPSAKAIKQRKRFEDTYPGQLFAMWEQLSTRKNLLRFRLTDEQWTLHDRTFRSLMSRIHLRGWSQLSDVVKRSGILAYRIAMICTALRIGSQRLNVLRKADTLECSDADLTVGLDIAVTLAEHSLRYATTHLAKPEPPDPRMQRISVMLNGVSEQFQSGEAYAAAQSARLGVSERTLREDLKFAEKRGQIVRVHNNGRWSKTLPPTGAGSDASVGSNP